MSDFDVDACLERADAGDRRAINALYDHAYSSKDFGIRERANEALARTDPRVELNARDGTVLIEIPAGDCWLASQERWVSMPTFHIAREPVTNRQYQEFLFETGYEPTGHGYPGYLAQWIDGAPPEELLDHPVVDISLLDALAYCKWAGLTLPSEWMWEKAAAGIEGKPRPWGDASASPRLARVMTDSTCAVGTYRKVRTSFGCQDMIGNVSEWCLPTQHLDDDVMGADIDSFDLNKPEKYDDIHAVVRGSAFLRNQASLMSCQHTRALSMGRRNRWVGFRPATLLASSESAASHWGELRSVCHDMTIDGVALLASVERVLATWPPDADNTSEVSEYLRAHLVEWSFHNGNVPPIPIQAEWFNGRGRRVFEALHPTANAPRPDYGLLDRCAAAFDSAVSRRGYVSIGEVDDHDAALRLYDYLLPRASAPGEGDIQNPTRIAPGVIPLERWGELLSDQRARHSGLPEAQIMFSNVHLSRAGARIPKLKLYMPGRVWKLELITEDVTLARRNEWSPRNLLQLLIAASVLAEEAGLKICLEHNVYETSREDILRLTEVYASRLGDTTEPG